MLSEMKTDSAFIYARKSTEDKNKQVASISEQLAEINKDQKLNNIPVLDTYTETKTGKISGVRAEFYKMLARIDNGEANTIICWKADRLARNGGDGGKIIELVDSRKLKIVTPDNTYTRENSMFLWIEFMSSTKLSKDISDNIIRNNDSKISKGISPSRHLFYIFNPDKLKGEKDHIPNPLNWGRAREWVEMMLSGNYTVESSLEIMTAKGLLNNKGKPISKTRAYEFFRDIFYTGLFKDKSGEIQEGIHKPLLTMSDFKRIQKIIGKRTNIKDWTNPLPLQGLFKCGFCGYTITGEKHAKSNYYRCTKKSPTIKCTEDYLDSTEMNRQTEDYVNDVELIPELIEWTKQTVREQNQVEYKNLAKEREQQSKLLADIDRQKSELRAMRTEGYYPDETVYNKKKEKLLKQEQIVKQDIVTTDDSYWDSLFEKLMNFTERVKELYESDDPVVKRLIVEIIGSNFILQEKKLKIKAKDAFVVLQMVKNDFYQKNLWLESEKSSPKSSKDDITYPQLSLSTAYGVTLAPFDLSKIFTNYQQDLELKREFEKLKVIPEYKYYSPA